MRILESTSRIALMRRWCKQNKSWPIASFLPRCKNSLQHHTPRESGRLCRCASYPSVVRTMAENVPPGSATKAAATTDDSNRGLPYYEKLRRDLRDTLQKKRLLDKNIVGYPLSRGVSGIPADDNRTH